MKSFQKFALASAMMAGLALSGCASGTTASGDATSATGSAVASPSETTGSSTSGQVSIRDYLVGGQWHCTGDKMPSNTVADKVGFMGADVNLVPTIENDVIFSSNGTLKVKQDATVWSSEEWDYVDGALILPKTYIKVPETISVPGKAVVAHGVGEGPADTSASKYDATTEVSFEPNMMIMKTAEYLNPSQKALNPDQTVTCRK